MPPSRRSSTWRGIFADPHYKARDIITEVDGVKMQNVVARLSKTPGRIRHVGKPLDADTDAVRREAAAKRRKD